ncbi:MAG: hypothetical protein R2771_11500 [Saprospiraceae bacterium]
MKKSILVLMIIGFSFVSKAQKVDIDNVYYKISLVGLPDNYIPEENRTYSISNNYSSLIPLDIDENVKIYGWKRVSDNANLNVYIVGDRMLRGKADKKSKVEKKNG